MTKRPSPFEPSICRQSKIHLNNFENDSKTLKSVKEQTLKKLIDASRKLPTIILDNVGYSNSESDTDQKNKNHMQKCVTDYFTVNGNKINDNGRILVGSFEAAIKCSFCDSNTSSVHQCVECLEFYCPACSFALYDSSDDKRVCLSCS